MAMWCVVTFRDGRADVWVDAETPEIALATARRVVTESDFIYRTEGPRAYEHKGPVSEAFWRGDTLMYPETELFEDGA